MNELTISLTRKTGNPMYEQIYEFIRNEIQNGKIRAGEKLPSTRALSAHLGVSRSTVDMAYEQLLAEGYMAALPCKGYYACEINQLYRVPTVSGKRAEEKESIPPKYDYDFAMNGIDRDGFPYHTWRKISKNVLNEDDGTLFQLGDSQGQEALRREIADYLHHARGVNCHAGQIVVGAGNDYLLLLLHVMLGMDWKIAIDNPTYISAYQDFRKMGYELCPIEPDEMGMDPQQLEQSGANLAYVMPSHQFPLGSVMPIKRRQQLLSWAAKGERYLIEDDYDSEFRYKGKPIPSLQGFDSHGRVIYLGTFSRSLAPAIRISYMVLPESLRKRYLEQAKSFSVTVSRVDQKILEVFLKEGHFERHLNRMRGVYRAKHDCLLGEMRKLREICRVHGENAGVHIVVEMKNGMSEQEAVQRAKQAGIRLHGLSGYCVQPLEKRKNPIVLMGYATLKEEEIKVAVEKLLEVWSRK